jgi:hypothetical protein
LIADWKTERNSESTFSKIRVILSFSFSLFSYYLLSEEMMCVRTGVCTVQYVHTYACQLAQDVRLSGRLSSVSMYMSVRLFVEYNLSAEYVCLSNTYICLSV